MKDAGKFRKMEKIVTVFIFSIGVGLLLFVFYPLFSGFPLTRTHHGQSPDQNAARNLKTAISAFHTEYRRYPLGEEKMTFDIDGDTGEELMKVLTGLDGDEKDSLNPRRITFFTGMLARKRLDGSFVKGIELSLDGKSAKYWDHWGNLFRVRLDTDGNRRVANPGDPDIDSSVIPESILVWSAGKDGDFSTWKDNVKTW